MRRDEIDAVVREVWESVLSTEIGPGADFFDQGGHSFLAIQIVARIEERLGVAVPVMVLFDHSEVDDFVDQVAEHAAQADSVAG